MNHTLAHINSEYAGRHGRHCLEKSELYARGFTLDKEEVFAPESHDAKGIFSKVIVERKPRVSHDATEVKHVRSRVIRRAAEQRFRCLRLSNLARELEKSDEEWTRIRATKRKMIGRAENSSTLGFVLDSIHARNQLESLNRFGHVTGFEVFPSRMCEASNEAYVCPFPPTSA